jgi:lipopolysaccharide exporter
VPSALISRIEPLPLKASLGSLLPALGACVPMVAAVLLVRTALVTWGEPKPWLSLGLQILAGGLGYVGGALVVARRTSEDLMERLFDAVRSRRTAA